MKKGKLTERFGMKLLVWFLLALCVLGAMVSAVGIYAAWELDVYSVTSAEELKREQFNDIIASAGYDIARFVVADGQTQYAEFLAEQKNAEYRLLDPEGTELWKSAGYDAQADSPYRYSHILGKVTLSDGTDRYYYNATQYRRGGFAGPAPAPTPVPTVTPTSMPTQAPAENTSAVPSALPPAAAETEEAEYLLEAVIDPVLPLRDEYYWTARGMDLLWAMRYGVYILAGLSLLLGALCYIFLLCAAGHRAGADGLTPGYLTRVPFDLLTAATAFLCAGCIWVSEEATRYMPGVPVPPGCGSLCCS